MSGGDVRKLSNQDIQLEKIVPKIMKTHVELLASSVINSVDLVLCQVQNRIEQCLQHYMNKKEVLNTLVIQDNIEPCITELVWQRLEEENQEFFKAYYLKLLVKDQIMEFNRLLSEQVELMHRIGSNGIAPMLPSNGSHVSPSQHISTSCAAPSARHLKKEDMHQANLFQSCGSAAVGPNVQGNVGGSGHGTRIDVPPNLFLTQNSNVGLAQTMNGKIVKAEAGYAGSSHFDLNPHSNYLESRPLMGDPSVSSFSSVDSNAQHLNDTILDGDTPSFGFLSQIQQMLSLQEFAADFTSSSDLLEGYCRPPFQSSDTTNFVDPRGDIESLDPESESLRFQCFGGD